jgi:hypothetical protein
MNRRESIHETAAGLAGAGRTLGTSAAGEQPPGERPRQAAAGARVLNPRGRVPVSLIIDDSTCLVNLAHFCIPQFHEVFPDRYQQPWRTLPREIPDAFVRKFGEWCRERGVKGKYSVVPYPACVGWVDRDLPGWSRAELDASLDLLRTFIAADWDFHPEMVSHTWVIDPSSGRPFQERTDAFMENWRWTDGKSADQIAGYLAYALGILKNVGIECEGITTPGGFGNRALPELSRATLEACRSVFRAEIPHYFRHLFTDERSVAPRVEYASGLDGPDPRCVVSIIGGTGDWFGGWDGLTPGSVDRLVTADGQAGRLPELVRRGEPAIMVCHWPGIYFNGEEVGFKIFQEAVRRLEAAHDDLVWMKLSDIARYWAARELTRLQREGQSLRLQAPFACPDFTVRVPTPPATVPTIYTAGSPLPLRRVDRLLQLERGTWAPDGDAVVVCFDLPRGETTLELVGEAG